MAIEPAIHSRTYAQREIAVDIEAAVEIRFEQTYMAEREHAQLRGHALEAHRQRRRCA